MHNFVDAVPGINITGKNEDPTVLIDWFDDGKDLGHEDEHKNNFRFLSNFYPDEPFSVALSTKSSNGQSFNWTEREFATGEHAYQAAKAATSADFHAIADAPTPAAAKKMGREINMVAGWDATSLDVMRQVLLAKFALGRQCTERLVETDVALLVEGTYWFDKIWGVDLRTQGTPGQNLLGMLLMERREQLFWLIDNSPILK